MSRLTFLLTVLTCAASATWTAAAPPARECQFTYRPLAVGDEARETLRCAIELKTIRAVDGQVIDVGDQTALREEQTLVTRLATAPGQTAKARLTYETSEQTSKSRLLDPQQTERPVAGKTYIVVRQGDELIISDQQGKSPPAEERQIVARTLDSLGRPNPLGKFFDGRSIALGETVQLPPEFTEKLLSGWDESLAKLPLEVILMGTAQLDGQLCAMFHTPPGAGKRNPVEGKMLIELATCRLAMLELRGPVARTERRGPPGEEFDVRHKGKLQIATHIEHIRVK